MTPGITLAMIVKDDAIRLRRCLQSVQGAVDEMVIVDTGSTDATVSVAKEFGARVIEIAWPGAFDAALNVALDAVGTTWTLRMDSDEWFGELVADRLQAIAKNEEVFGYFFIRRDLYDHIAPSEVDLFRLWRTDARLRYEGIVHENIPSSAILEAAAGRHVIHEPLVFMHDGYLGRSLEEKRKRNIDLLREQLKAQPGILYYEICLAEALVADGDEQGIEMAQRLADRFLAQEDQPQDVPLASWVVGVSLETTPDDQLFTSRIQNLIRYALRWHHRSVVALWGVATTEMRRGSGFHAYQALLELEAMGETGDYDRLAGSPEVFIKDGAWLHLATVAEALGKRDVARRNWQRILDKDPANPVAKERLRELA
jgi:hypothetical protein